MGDNASPTCSLNSVAEKQQGGNKVAREVLIASILNHLEQLVDLVEGGTWAQVEQEYYKGVAAHESGCEGDRQGREGGGCRCGRHRQVWFPQSVWQWQR